MTKNIDLRGLDRDTLLMVAVRACDRLCAIANMLTSDEGDPDDTEDDFGLPFSEVVEMAHDNMITDARRTIESVFRDVAEASPTPPPPDPQVPDDRSRDDVETKPQGQQP